MENDILRIIMAALCSGVLFTGFALYLFMFIKLKSIIYISVSLIAALALVYVLGEAGIVLHTGLLKNFGLSLKIYRVQQLAVVFFIPVLFLLLNGYLKPSARWTRINLLLSAGFSFVSMGIAIISFLQDDLFISMLGGNGPQEASIGILYRLRDILLSTAFLYTVFCTVFYMIRTHKFKRLLPPLTGLCIAVLSGFADLSKVYTGHYLFFDFMTGSRSVLGFTLAVFSFMIALIYNYMKKSRNLAISNEEISRSRARYRLLAEGVDECVFTLNRQMFFTSANKQARKIFQLKNDDMENIKLYDVLYFEDEYNIGKLLIAEKFLNLYKKQQDMNFSALVKEMGRELNGYYFHFSCHRSENSLEFVGRAVASSSQSIAEYTDFEHIRLEIPNSLMIIDSIIQKLTVNTSANIDPAEMQMIKMGLREIIINAIEHGNLDITFDEKTKSMEDGSYFDLILERQEMESNQKKKVSIEYINKEDSIQFKISDEGEGFDYQEILNSLQQYNSEGLAHGRGISLAYGIFDKVRFNMKGNQVLLFKYKN